MLIHIRPSCKVYSEHAKYQILQHVTENCRDAATEQVDECMLSENVMKVLFVPVMIYCSTGNQPNQTLEQPNHQITWYRDIARTLLPVWHNRRCMLVSISEMLTLILR